MFLALEDLPRVIGSSNPWVSTLAKFGVLFFVLVLLNLAIVLLFGPLIWREAGYFFGADARTTFCVFMFVEGGFFLVLGSMWASGPLDNVFYGRTQKTSSPITGKDWAERKSLSGKPSEVIRVSLLTGGVLLVTSIVLFFA